MAKMRVDRGGGVPFEPFRSKPELSKQCREGIDHTKEVADRTVFKRYDGVTFTISQAAGDVQRVHHLFFGKQADSS